MASARITTGAGEPGGPPRYEGFARVPLAGRWRPGRSGTTVADTDPWSGDTLAEIPRASAGDLDEALAGAERAQRQWAAQPPARRAEVMLAAAGVIQARQAEITEWLIRETGSPAARAGLEWSLVRGALLEAASVPHQLAGRIIPSGDAESRGYRRPAGVVAVIGTWDFPMRSAARCAAAALATGNAVVLKPASDTPVTGGLLLAKVLEEAGLPGGLLSVVIGGGGDIGDAIARHPVPRVISFTGSAAVAGKLARAAGLKRLALEHHGHGPLVVLGDADLPQAVDAAVFGSPGRQVCMITSRLVVERTVYDEFTGRLLALVRCLQAGDPAASGTDIGPVINARQLSGLQGTLKRARDEGARQVQGGEPGGPTGLLLPPHVLLARGDVATTREEVPGPVITVMRAGREDEALALAPGASAVFTGDADRGVRFALRAGAPATQVNGGPAAGHSGLPAEAFTTEQWITVPGPATTTA